MTDQEYWEKLDRIARELFSKPEGPSVWRRFHCLCLRRVWDYISDQSCKKIVEVTESYIAGELSQDELARVWDRGKSVTDEKWSIVFRKKSPESHLWPLSDEVDESWIHYSCWSCATDAADPTLRPSMIPGASTIPVWAMARRNLRERGVDVDSESARDVIQQEWDRLNAVEEEAQLQILLGLVRERQVSEDGLQG